MEEPRLGRIEQDRHEERTLIAAQSLVALSTNRMACQQDEQKQIRTQIEAASTSTLAPKMSETELIQKLVCNGQRVCERIILSASQILQFLQHDGYVETARAFAEEVHAEKKALSLDPNAVVSGFDVKEDEDAGHRQRMYS
jgi:hypothetical protein